MTARAWCTDSSGWRVFGLGDATLAGRRRHPGSAACVSGLTTERVARPKAAARASVLAPKLGP